jgi:hypothetical protein
VSSNCQPYVHPLRLPTRVAHHAYDWLTSTCVSRKNNISTIAQKDACTTLNLLVGVATSLFRRGLRRPPTPIALLPVRME